MHGMGWVLATTALIQALSVKPALCNDTEPEAHNVRSVHICEILLTGMNTVQVERGGFVIAHFSLEYAKEVAKRLKAAGRKWHPPKWPSSLMPEADGSVEQIHFDIDPNEGRRKNPGRIIVARAKEFGPGHISLIHYAGTYSRIGSETGQEDLQDIEVVGRYTGENKTHALLEIPALNGGIEILREGRYNLHHVRIGPEGTAYPDVVVHVGDIVELDALARPMVVGEHSFGGIYTENSLLGFWHSTNTTIRDRKTKKARWERLTALYRALRPGNVKVGSRYFGEYKEGSGEPVTFTIERQITILP